MFCKDHLWNTHECIYLNQSSLIYKLSYILVSVAASIIVRLCIKSISSFEVGPQMSKFSNERNCFGVHVVGMKHGEHFVCANYRIPCATKSVMTHESSICNYQWLENLTKFKLDKLVAIDMCCATLSSGLCQMHITYV